MKNIDNVNLVVLSGQNESNFQQESLYQKAYAFYKRHWTSVWRDNGTNETIFADPFLRQDFIVLFVEQKKSKIVGMQFHSLWDLSKEYHLEHSYFRKSFTGHYLQELFQRDFRQLLSFEYLSVDSSWNKDKANGHLANAMIGVGIKILCHLGLDAIVAPARSDRKVNEMVWGWGGLSLQSGLVQHNTPVDLIAIVRGKTSAPNRAVDQLTDRLWSQRLDYTGIFKEQRMLPLSA